jgi:hypothetical protein
MLTRESLLKDYLAIRQEAEEYPWTPEQRELVTELVNKALVFAYWRGSEEAVCEEGRINAAASSSCKSLQAAANSQQNGETKRVVRKPR